MGLRARSRVQILAAAALCLGATAPLHAQSSPQVAQSPTQSSPQFSTQSPAQTAAPVAVTPLAAPQAASPAATAAVSAALAVALSAAKSAQAVPLAHPPQFKPIVAAAPQPSPAAPAVSTVLTAAEVQSLPASGRNWQQFLLDTPASSAATGGAQASFRGASRQSADVTVDGVSTRLAFGSGALAEPRSQDSGSYAQSGGQSSGLGQSQSGLARGGRGFSVSEAAIRRVETIAGNAEAEGASAAGGRINVETAQGTTQFHGQAFLFDRQNN